MLPADKIENARPWLRLTLVPRVGLQAQRALVARFGCARAIFDRAPGEWEPVIGREAARALAGGPDPRLVERTLRWLEEEGRHLVACVDPAYPQLLLHISDAPAALYARGRVELLNAPTVAIVGSRNATVQGRGDARAFAQALSAAGLCIASGMALGIDSAAHQGALAAPGSTVAVLGTGLDVVYPPSNRALAQEIAARGCLLSEFPLGMPPLAINFPRRNRLISGLAKGVLVIEAAPGSGSLITAHSASDQGREVFALPGSIHATLAKGCHELIKEGAKLVECAQDILEEIRWTVAAPVRDTRPDEGDAFLEAMGFAPASADEIALRTGLGAAAVAVELSLREIEGRIAALPGGRFQRLSGTAAGPRAAHVIE